MTPFMHIVRTKKRLLLARLACVRSTISAPITYARQQPNWASCVLSTSGNRRRDSKEVRLAAAEATFACAGEAALLSVNGDRGIGAFLRCVHIRNVANLIFKATFAGQRGSTRNKLASYRSFSFLRSPFYSAPVLVGVYQIGTKSILESNPQRPKSRCVQGR